MTDGMIDLSLSESEARTLARLLDVHRRDMPQHEHLAVEIGRQMRGQMMPTWHLRRLWETEAEHARA